VLDQCGLDCATKPIGSKHSPQTLPFRLQYRHYSDWRNRLGALHCDAHNIGVAALTSEGKHKSCTLIGFGYRQSLDTESESQPDASKRSQRSSHTAESVARLCPSNDCLWEQDGNSRDLRSHDGSCRYDYHVSQPPPSAPSQYSLLPHSIRTILNMNVPTQIVSRPVATVDRGKLILP